MVPGVPPLVWLWNQPAELHCLSKSSQSTALSSPVDKWRAGYSNTSLSPNNTFVYAIRDSERQDRDDKLLIVFLHHLLELVILPVCGTPLEVIHTVCVYAC